MPTMFRLVALHGYVHCIQPAAPYATLPPLGRNWVLPLNLQKWSAPTAVTRDDIGLNRLELTAACTLHGYN